MHAQDDLILRVLRMLEDTFSNNAVHLFTGTRVIKSSDAFFYIYSLIAFSGGPLNNSLYKLELLRAHGNLF